jgi:hypothetical protein
MGVFDIRQGVKCNISIRNLFKGIRFLVLITSASFFMLCMASGLAEQQITQTMVVSAPSENDLQAAQTDSLSVKNSTKNNADKQLEVKAMELSMKKTVTAPEVNTKAIKVVDQASAKIVAASQKKVDRGAVDRSQFLLKAVTVDKGYIGMRIPITKKDRDLLEHIVMGEAGDEDYAGKVIIAQAIRDGMLTDGLTVEGVWRDFSYTKHISKEPIEEVKRAVSFVFDVGGSAVQHRILYFYAPRLVRSSFHESQIFVVEHGGHRVFDRR